MLVEQTWSPFFNVPFESLFRRIVALPPKGDRHSTQSEFLWIALSQRGTEKMRSLALRFGDRFAISRSLPFVGVRHQ
jgi:hypothetical protein